MTTQISIPTERTQTLEMAGKKATAAVQAKAASRMPFIDNVRVFLTILVVVFHLAITYGAAGSWPYRERPSTEITEILLSLFIIWNQFYFMGLFFLISGYFVPGSVDRKGGWRYFKDRLVRLGIPLVVYSALISPYVEWMKAIHEGYFSGNFGQFFAYYWDRKDFAPGPLWFLEILLAFSAIYVVGRAIFRLVAAKQAKIAASPVRRPVTHAHILALILVLVPLNYVVRFFSPIGVEWNHIQLAFMPQYLLLFAAGILAYRRDWLPDLPAGVRRVWNIVAILAIIAMPLIMVLGGGTESLDPFMGGKTLQSLILSSWEAIFCVSMSILVLSVFRSRFDFQGSLGKFFSKNAYTVYIIHAPLIVSLCWLLGGVTIYPLLKWVMVIPIAIGLCFLTSNYIVCHIPLAEKVL